MFNTDRNSVHIHSVLTEKFPVLNTCGGYIHSVVSLIVPMTCLRLRHLMLECLSYLKDIFYQAKLFIRPLQCDNTMEDVKSLMVSDISKMEI